MHYQIVRAIFRRFHHSPTHTYQYPKGGTVGGFSHHIRSKRFTLDAININKSIYVCMYVSIPPRGILSDRGHLV